MTERALQSDAEFFKQRGFGLWIGFGERPALLVIDMLKAFTNPKMMLGADLEKEIEAIKPLIAVAHERDIPVIFSTVIYNDADLKDAGIWALKQKGVVTLKGGSDGVESDGIVRRIVHHQVPPKVEYGLTDWGQALCPALDALLTWAEQRIEHREPAASAATPLRRGVRRS